MHILLTGAAGFIGYHVAEKLLERGERVLGVDDVNDYYDVRLKEARLARLDGKQGFTFVRADISDRAAMEALAAAHPEIDAIVHLAAQAGVRYSLESPRSYIRSNIVGQLEMLEWARHLKGLRHFVYASSSSVYGATSTLPFALDDRCDRPRSLYAATKRADELMSLCYSQLYGIPSTGLRFFTVYGPWGRPDMAPMLFAKAILAGDPIRVFNGGKMERDFTYIDDIVAGVVASLDKPPQGAEPHILYNLGNHRAEPLLRFIEVMETACGRPAKTVMEPMQPGDVPATYADISAAAADLGFAPRVSIDEGIPRFVAWYRSFYDV